MEYLKLGFFDTIVGNLSVRYGGNSTKCMRKVVPHILGNRHNDLIIRSPIGTGKTVTVLSSLIHVCVRDKLYLKSKGVYAIVVAASKDSAIQLLKEAYKLANGTGVRIGYAINKKGKVLDNLTSAWDILIGTVDILPDLTLNKKTFSIDSLRYVAVFNPEVLENDKSFVEYFDRIVGSMQTTEFFTIVASPQMDYICQINLEDPLTIDCASDLSFQKFKHEFINVYDDDENFVPKIYYLLFFLAKRCHKSSTKEYCPRAVIFVNDVRIGNVVTIFLLKNKFRAFLIHDERSKDECNKTYERFLAGDLSVIVCTDLVDNRLEFPVDYMINFDLPTESQYYLRFVQRFKQVCPAKKIVKAMSFFNPVENAEIAYQLEKFLLYFDVEIPDYIPKAYTSDNALFIREVSKLDRMLKIFDKSFQLT